MLKLDNMIKFYIPKMDSNFQITNLYTEVGCRFDSARQISIYDSDTLHRGEMTTYIDEVKVVQLSVSQITMGVLQDMQQLIDYIFIWDNHQSVSVGVNGVLYILENTEDFYELQADVFQLI